MSRKLLIVFACTLIGLATAVPRLEAVLDDYKCKPSTVPVGSCPCPNSVQDDVCEGQLPKIGNMYGDVECQPVSGETCDGDFGPQDKNDCGIVYRCPDVQCGTSIVFFPECSPHPQKPDCTGKWGGCVWSD